MSCSYTLLFDGGKVSAILSVHGSDLSSSSSVSSTSGQTRILMHH